VVPYAAVSNDNWFSIKNHPVKNRILFAGTANLRKGIHILGMAAQKLSFRKYDFRVAGGVTRLVREHKLTRHLNFLGRVPRSEIQDEFKRTMIFVLPSLAEGSAYVTYEALAAGLPVVTTESTGSVVRNGIEGFIVPEGDADALASAIEELLENPDLRERMAWAARQRAQDYTWEKYEQRLLTVFQSV
jgi:glycosyltransferase involved in cell wall biosynthesis